MWYNDNIGGEIYENETGNHLHFKEISKNVLEIVSFEDKNLLFSENIFIIAPSHHENFNNIALPEYTYFDTPIGSLEVNNRLIKDIAEKFPCIINNDVFDNEHSIEVQLPFIQHLFFPKTQSAIDFVKGLKKLKRKAKIVPILVGKCNYKCYYCLYNVIIG